MLFQSSVDNSTFSYCNAVTPCPYGCLTIFVGTLRAASA